MLSSETGSSGNGLRGRLWSAADPQNLTWVMPAEERVIEPDVVVVASGPGPAMTLPRASTVVAADGGLDRAAALGLQVDVVIGDLDSASPNALANAEAAGARVVRHPIAKDATDLELALDEAVALRARRVLVVGSGDGRLDHLLASLLLLGSERYAQLELDALVGDALVHVVRSERRLRGAPGELVTLVALGGPAEGVTTAGLEYPSPARPCRRARRAVSRTRSPARRPSCRSRTASSSQCAPLGRGALVLNQHKRHNVLSLAAVAVAAVALVAAGCGGGARRRPRWCS